MAQGPLHGLTVLEFGGIGPGPFAAMLLADMGADVIRIDRPASGAAPVPLLDAAALPDGRGKRSVFLDIKAQRGDALSLISRADVLIEGFRPGVMERLGYGPEPCLALNPGLIFARLTGWGQNGPLAQSAGHDVNYLALTGALYAMGHGGQVPAPPLNLLGDYAGGSLMAVIGILAALQARSTTGKGQVVDAAIVDGVSLLTAPLRSFRAQGLESADPGENLFDCGFPFNAVYRCADGRDIAIGAIEEPFFQALVEVIGLDASDFPNRFARTSWPAARARLTAQFARRTQAEWVAACAGVDCCLTPVLTLEEAAQHSHARARASFAQDDIPAPAPRFLGTPCATPRAAPKPGADTAAILSELASDARGGLSERKIVR